MPSPRHGFVFALLLVVSPAVPQPATPTRVLVAYYSETGNTAALARAVRDGGTLVEGVEVSLRPVDAVSRDDILQADGLLVGTPVHWASVASPVKAFLDRVGNTLAEAGRLQDEGRTGGVFCTGGAVASGKELARLTVLAAFLNMRFVVVGGVAADGFGTLGAQATVGEEDPGLSEEELAEARRFGERFARLTRRIRQAAGR